MISFFKRATFDGFMFYPRVYDLLVWSCQEKVKGEIWPGGRGHLYFFSNSDSVLRLAAFPCFVLTFNSSVGGLLRRSRQTPAPVSRSR